MVELLLDGDWLIYTAGFAGQRSEYVTPWGDDREAVYPNQTELAKGLGFERPQDLIEFQVPVYSRVVTDPLENVLHTVKSMIETQIRETQKKFKGEDVHITIFVDGDGNFRSRIASIRPYKGTRASNSKPLLFPDIRQYLIDVWDAHVVFDQESDDEMAIRQTLYAEQGTKSVICAVDKDMLQVPGFHRNPNKGWKRVTKHGGLLFLYRQCLSGDPVDNIGGCYKLGPKKAEAIIKEEMCEEEMWDATVAAYAESLDKYGEQTGYAHLTPFNAAYENMELVYLRRYRDEQWMPPPRRG